MSLPAFVIAGKRHPGRLLRGKIMKIRIEAIRETPTICSARIPL